jgi:catechol 2,3-dioxygenase-like lactoylglutathione lyase family enzyme
MIDHFGVQAHDVPASAAFYLKVFAPLGVREAMRFPVQDSFVVGFSGADGEPRFWISPTDPATEPSRGLHIAFSASDRKQVEAIHEIAVADDIEVLHPPREWPEYHPGYYAVFLRDPDGNNVEAVCHRPA